MLNLEINSYLANTAVGEAEGQGYAFLRLTSSASLRQATKQGVVRTAAVTCRRARPQVGPPYIRVPR
jgi:hypothetical protein